MFGKYIKKSFAAVLSAAVLSASLGLTTALPAKADIDVAAEFPYLTSQYGVSLERVQEIVGHIYEGLENREQTIYIGGTQDEFQNHSPLYGELFYEVAQNRDIGLVVQSNTIQYGYNSRYGSFLRPTYLEDNGAYDEYYAVLDSIKSRIGNDWCDYEKALFLHDYLAEHYDYDFEHLNDNSYNLKYVAYGMMQNGKGVCNAYAMMYSYILNALGVKTEIVQSDNINHAWNLVRLDGQWYHVDITWDDSNHGGFAGLMSHDNFLRTTQEMIETEHVPDNYQAGNNLDWMLLCGTSIFDTNVITTPLANEVAFWNGVNSTIVPIEGQTSADVKWAAVYPHSQTAEIDVYDIEDLSTACSQYHITDFEEYWLDPSGGSYWPGVYSTLEVCDNVLFYTDSQRVYAYFDGNIELIGELDSTQLSQGRIYGLEIENGELFYYLSEMPQTRDPYGDDVTTPYSLGDAQELADIIKSKFGLKNYYTSATLADTITLTVCLDVAQDLIRETASPNDVIEIAIGSNKETVPVHSLPWSYFDVNGTGNQEEYRFCELRLSPRQMDETITLTLYCGNHHGSVYSFTGNEYLNDVMKLTESSDKDHVMADATQIYSAYANNYFDSDNSSVNSLTNEQTQALENVAAPNATRTLSGTLPAGVTYSGSTLMMRNRISVRHYFRLASGKTLTVTDDSGSELTVYSKLDEQGDTIYYVELPAVSPDNLAVSATVTVNGTYNITYSPYCYANAKLNSETTAPELKTLLKAMCLYGRAAENYNGR